MFELHLNYSGNTQHRHGTVLDNRRGERRLRMYDYVKRGVIWQRGRSHKHSSDVNIIRSRFLSSSSLAVLSLACQLVTQLATINCRIWPRHLSVALSNYAQTHTRTGTHRTHLCTCWIPISRPHCGWVWQRWTVLELTLLVQRDGAKPNPPDTPRS